MHVIWSPVNLLIFSDIDEEQELILNQELLPADLIEVSMSFQFTFKQNSFSTSKLAFVIEVVYYTYNEYF